MECAHRSEERRIKLDVLKGKLVDAPARSLRCARINPELGDHQRGDTPRPAERDIRFRLTTANNLHLQHKFSSLDGYASANITRFCHELRPGLASQGR